MKSKRTKTGGRSGAPTRTCVGRVTRSRRRELLAPLLNNVIDNALGNCDIAMYGTLADSNAVIIWLGSPTSHEQWRDARVLANDDQCVIIRDYFGLA